MMKHEKTFCIVVGVITGIGFGGVLGGVLGGFLAYFIYVNKDYFFGDD